MALMCANCGTENAEDVSHCSTCGVELGRATTPDTHPDEVTSDASRTEREQRDEPGS